MERFRLTEDQLYKVCDCRSFDFETTEDLTPLQGIIGQDRAVKAMDFGLKIEKSGYNIYVSGAWGTGRKSYVNLITETMAIKKDRGKDWVYVNNFENPYNPKAIYLEGGEAKTFEKLIKRSLRLIKKQVKEAFASRDYENSKAMLMEAYNHKTREIIDELNEIGKKFGFVFSHNDQGLVSVPLKEDGNPMTEKEYKNISDEEFTRLKNNSNTLGIEAVDYFNQLRSEEEKLSAKVRAMDESIVKKIVEFNIESMRKKLKLNPGLEEYLQDMAGDIVENLDRFRVDKEESGNSNPLLLLTQNSEENFFDRYEINILIDNGSREAAPVVFESNPTYYNLIGAVEYRNEMGVMKTDFTQIKSGTLHEANGGYLVIEAKELLSAPFAWQALKRTLLTGKLHIESLGKHSGAIVTSTIKPEPIPIDVKVILIGDYYLYSLLHEYDEEFRKLFRIMADFDSEMDRDDDNVMRFARFIATHCEKENLLPFDKGAVGRIVEYSARLADQKDKLTARFNKIVAILIEADQWARIYGDQVVSEKHIEKTLYEINQRTNKVEEKVMEMFESNDYLLEVQGKKIGEINGLAVLGTGQYTFGKPSKITVSTYHGKAGIINIEREVRTSGSIHDKGVMILTGYMGYKYAQDKPLALSASIVFEQLYSGVDGDSASSTELYALLSSIAGIPVNQGIAVTGSINQRGQIQPIGGVNEKIEGFFKVCRMKGLSGEQGVIIPHQNVKNLMLSEEVLQAVIARDFHIYSVRDVDEGIEILMGMKPGDIETKGTVHYLVNERLKVLAKNDSEAGE
ncbi:MAG: ATP-dependent protease [delta proteobacterium ML8_F1]|nr:MAG: ATP-dependent protease [delta proteobacterium ML8_F1]